MGVHGQAASPAIDYTQLPRITARKYTGIHPCEKALLCWRTTDHRRLQILPLLRCITDRKSTRLNSSHLVISYAVFCLKKNTDGPMMLPTTDPPHPLPRRLD